MLVKERMTKGPITITKDTSFNEIVDLMKKHNIRRLPVVDGKRLVGIVTNRDVRTASASPATSLEIHELLYLLDRLKAKDIMIKKVITVGPDTPIEGAARLIIKYKVGGLPVVVDSILVGIITETDLLQQLVDLLEAKEAKKK